MNFFAFFINFFSPHFTILRLFDHIFTFLDFYNIFHKFLNFPKKFYFNYFDFFITFLTFQHFSPLSNIFRFFFIISRLFPIFKLHQKVLPLISHSTVFRLFKNFLTINILEFPERLKLLNHHKA